MVRTVLPFRQQLSRSNEIVKDFTDSEQKLIDVEYRIQVFVKEMPLVKHDVLDWLEETQSVLEDVRKLKHEIEEKKRRFWNLISIRHDLSKKVVKQVSVIKKLLATQVDSDGFIPGIEFLLNYENLLYCSKSFYLAFEKIVEALKDDAVSMIAVWGMAGVGKTTLVKEVEKKATGLNFYRCIRISVSCPSDLQKIQDEIAASLSERKNEERILIILDDVWDGLNLKDIGIPYGEDDKGCKVLLATRCEQVCIDMGIQKVIRLDILSDEEACVLLKMNVGYQSGTDSPSITDAASEIAKECQGLPIALVDVGKSLNTRDLNMWETTSQSLRSPRFQDGKFFEALKATYECLQKSYDCLRKNTKLCFLLCSLFPQDSAIDVELLTRYAWGLGLYEGIDSINKVRCEVWAEIENLISSCLLLDYGESGLKMHNLVRDCALWIASQEKNSFMKEWQEVEDLPERFVGEDQLEILSLDGGGCRTSSSARKQGMKSLKVFTLRLLDGHFSAYALENLTNLRTLHLVCCQLHNISSLGKLEKLEILSFRGSDISELPAEIGVLNYLRLLDLFDCQKLQKVPLSLMRKLSQLEELYFNCCSFEEWWFEETSIEGSKQMSSEPSEIISSCPLPPNLQAYEIAIKEDGSCNDNHNPTSRILRVTVSLDTSKILHFNHVMRKQPAVGQSAKPLDKLSDSRLDQTELKLRSPHYASFGRLKVLILKDCHKLTSLSISLAWMEHLQELQIDGCHALKQITPDSYTLCWPRVVTLEITDCDLLEYVFRITTASFAPRLSVLNISHCPRLNRVIEVTNEHIELLQLQRLALKRLESLTTFCSGEFSIGLQSLEELEVEACPQLLSIRGIIRPSEVKNLCLFNVRSQLCEDITDHEPQSGNFLSRLTNLTLKELNELQIILKDPNQIVTFLNLSRLTVYRCNKLRNIFSITLARDLLHLSHLEVEECKELDQVFDSPQEMAERQDIKLPLQRLALKRLKGLTTFCSRESCIGLPSLEELEVEACPQLLSICEIIKSSQVKNLSLLNVRGKLCEDIVELQGGYLLSSLEKLMLKELSEFQVIFEDPSQIVTLQNLSHLTVSKFNKLRNIFSVRLARNLPQLSHLEVEECEELEQVVAQDEISSSSKAPQEYVCFPNLEEVRIMKCNKLSSLFPVSFCRLPKLKRLQVKCASNLRKIFGHDSHANMTKEEKLKEVSFPKLEELVLEHLPYLFWIATVGYSFVFPALIKLTVRECPRTIMRFSRIIDDSGGSYVRAKIEESKLLNEGKSTSIIQDIQLYAGQDIEWVHPEKGENVTTLDPGTRNKANRTDLFPVKRNKINITIFPGKRNMGKYVCR